VLKDFDAVIIGAGAAGLMCAIETGNRSRQMAVLEHTDRSAETLQSIGGVVEHGLFPGIASQAVICSTQPPNRRNRTRA
jgi:thioredoxin reductase